MTVIQGNKCMRTNGEEKLFHYITFKTNLQACHCLKTKQGPIGQ